MRLGALCSPAACTLCSTEWQARVRACLCVMRHCALKPAAPVPFCCCAGWPTGQDLYVSYVTSEVNGFNANLEDDYKQRVLVHSFAMDARYDPEPGNHYTYLLARMRLGDTFTHAGILRVEYSDFYYGETEPAAQVTLTRERRLPPRARIHKTSAPLEGVRIQRLVPPPPQEWTHPTHHRHRRLPRPRHQGRRRFSRSPAPPRAGLTIREQTFQAGCIT